jgi:hypothetical protein
MIVTFPQYPPTSRWHRILASKDQPLDYGNGETGGIRRLAAADMRAWGRNRLVPIDEEPWDGPAPAAAAAEG